MSNKLYEYEWRANTTDRLWRLSVEHSHPEDIPEPLREAGAFEYRNLTIYTPKDQ